MSSTIRIPSDLYQILQEIRLSLESRHYSAAPSIQDMVSIALQRFVRDWNDPDEQARILETLMENRRKARSKMGQRKRDSS